MSQLNPDQIFILCFSKIHGIWSCWRPKRDKDIDLVRALALLKRTVVSTPASLVLETLCFALWYLSDRNRNNKLASSSWVGHFWVAFFPPRGEIWSVWGGFCGEEGRCVFVTCLLRPYHFAVVCQLFRFPKVGLTTVASRLRARAV